MMIMMLIVVVVMMMMVAVIVLMIQGGCNSTRHGYVIGVSSQTNRQVREEMGRKRGRGVEIKREECSIDASTSIFQRGELQRKEEKEKERAVCWM